MKPNHDSNTLFPVIRAVPDEDRLLKGREKVACLSRQAREALDISARKSGILLETLLKKENGAPLPFNGKYWSLTHKSTYVGAVVARARIGIDIEKIRPVRQALFKKTADEDEWGLATESAINVFFRYWTAKEAVLKAAAVGLKDLSRCRVVRVADKNSLVINYLDKKWMVEHIFFDGHIASIVKAAAHIHWTLLNQSGVKMNLES
jgi:4'-phosphopantetheinyl transferase